LRNAVESYIAYKNLVILNLHAQSRRLAKPLNTILFPGAQWQQNEAINGLSG